MSYIPLNPANINDEIKINTKNNFNKTIKSKGGSNKVSNLNDIMSKIHNTNEDDDNDDENNYSKQKSTVINDDEFEKHINQNSYKDNNNLKSILKTDNQLQPNPYSDKSQDELANYNNSYSKNFYANNTMKSNLNYNTVSNMPQDTNQDISRFNNHDLLNKLNYIIYLLEEQYSEKTKYITEELILYLFLGIFIIFVLDSFAKASKYVR
tara:strand:- start:2333 stop:2959 length:627 start_codon:yes stop_codon:yes gene_type:complete